MATAPSDGNLPQRPLRLWPGVLLGALVLVDWFVIPLVVQDSMAPVLLGALAGGALIALWWLLFSRAPWVERIGALILMAAGFAVLTLVGHPTIRGALLYIFAVPSLNLGLVAALVATRRLGARVRRTAIAAALLLVCAVLAMIRTGGMSSAADSDLAWRFSPTPEERLLAAAEAPAGSAAAAPAVAGAAGWPGFRGRQRDGAVPDTAIATDWKLSPPAALWRRPVGPGWSSFAVGGELIYTQEQRGEDEAVSCYRLATGELVWQHRDRARFWEAAAGAGPRGTPTLAGDRVFSLGATGIVNALDAATGAKLWSRDAAAELEAITPTWGLSGSPLVVGELVIFAVSGRLAAYDKTTGEERWRGPAGGGSYSSPHLVTLDGVEQLLLLSSKAGARSVAPADGKVLWEHAWNGYPIVQPALTEDGGLLVSVSDKGGVRRLAVARGEGDWSATERWTSIGLKPYFNDLVVHRGHAYGFDGGILAAIDLLDGQRKWKGGRYGRGQLILLPQQDLLLVLSESGELALVAAKPDRFEELARQPAIEGKSWSHPVLVGDTLLVRNDQQMAAFRLAAAPG
jgi:outer membrane protein assembly factor BamB